VLPGHVPSGNPPPWHVKNFSPVRLLLGQFESYFLPSNGQVLGEFREDWDRWPSKCRQKHAI
jgi:hypothetical protein